MLILFQEERIMSDTSSSIIEGISDSVGNLVFKNFSIGSQLVKFLLLDHCCVSVFRCC